MTPNPDSQPVPDPTPATNLATPEAPVSAGHASPVTAGERIATLDVLRGFAVLGILIMNIQFFAMPQAAYSNPAAYGDLTGANYAVWLFSYLFANMKFITLFSILFGAGIVLMVERSLAKGEPRPVWVHTRRMLWLLAFGMVHAYGIWAGDILVAYATCGFVAVLLRRASAPVLITLGMVLICGGAVVFLLGGWSMPYWGDEGLREFGKQWAPDAETLGKELAAFRGNWLQQMPYRAETAFFFQLPGFFFFVFWRVGGMIVLGMGLMKSGFLGGAWPASRYWLVLVVGALAGIGLSAVGVMQNEAHQWSLEYGFFFGALWNYWGSLFLSLAYAAGLILLVRSGVLAEATRTLATAGRMAFTNYILQSVVCTLLFYGHGFGLFGKIDRGGQMGVVLAVWAVILMASPWWLAHHTYGPLEWLWRRLTYGAGAIANRPAPGQ